MDKFIASFLVMMSVLRDHTRNNKIKCLLVSLSFSHSSAQAGWSTLRWVSKGRERLGGRNRMARSLLGSDSIYQHSCKSQEVEGNGRAWILY